MDEENQKPTRNGYKVRAFSRAIQVINSLERPVVSSKEVRQLKGIGDGISRRIEYFLTGKTYEEPFDEAAMLSKAEKKRQQQILKTLQTVSGVGPKTAKDLLEAGCISVSNMREPKYTKLLSPSQKIGLRFFEDFERPVTRDEAELVSRFISENISCKFEIHLAGGYRRGAESFSDIDMLLFHPSHVHVPTPPPPEGESVAPPRRQVMAAFRNGYTPVREAQDSMLLRDVIEPLGNKGLIAAALTSGRRKWQGVVRIPEIVDGVWEDRGTRLQQLRSDLGTYKRMELNFVPMKSKGAALLALTGDSEFNFDLRAKASRLGMHLNEYGLWRWQPDQPVLDGEVGPSKGKGYWVFLQGESEAEIMKELGMEYVAPEKRNFSFLLERTPRARGRPRRVAE
ncbi:Nucleotidyltransferase [Leucogyrophana mollusca]|uniref:Nucleotidyltransferase n=1 Tax=Leucogyrophana mollusca TaxID=85980 RepID=A0ACB8BPI2_9AGAM|nr:Nucleotidyltransferase [Leucogyrophana mollusca]